MAPMPSQWLQRMPIPALPSHGDGTAGLSDIARAFNDNVRPVMTAATGA